MEAPGGCSKVSTDFPTFEFNTQGQVTCQISPSRTIRFIAFQIIMILWHRRDYESSSQNPIHV